MTSAVLEKHRIEPQEMSPSRSLVEASTQSDNKERTAKCSLRSGIYVLFSLLLGCATNQTASLSQQESLFAPGSGNQISQPAKTALKPAQAELPRPIEQSPSHASKAGNSLATAAWKGSESVHKTETEPLALPRSLRSPPPTEGPSSRREPGRRESGHQQPVAWNPPVAETLPEPTESPQESPPRQFIGFPEKDSAGNNDIRLSHTNDRISLTARDAPITAVLALIAEQHNLNIVAGEEVNQKISVTLNGVLLDDALDVILAVNGYAWSRHNNIVTISSIDGEKKASPLLHGRRVHVFGLNYVSAIDVHKVVLGLLSPTGQSFTTETSPTDKRRTIEQIVVEDLPPYVERVAEYIAQVDCPPRQVMVEAHVLQVALKDGLKHGVNLESILRVANSEVNIDAAGFAQGITPNAVLRINGTDLDSVIQAIKNTTDSKTLASPKVAVLNGQTANMQVGGKIGYLLTTTTQTSTLQSVNFLDFGVLLEVTPIITDDQQILLQVKPQVSTGRINATTQLPESETTEVSTTVLLADGEALVIGGLIKESDTDQQSKWPLLGDLWMIGRLFQHREVARERNEIIITLLPRIVPEDPGFRAANPAEVDQAHTPLFIGPLKPVDRSAWEPQLRDASHHRDGVPLPPRSSFDAANQPAVSRVMRSTGEEKIDPEHDDGLRRNKSRVIHAAVQFPEPALSPSGKNSAD